MLLSAADWWFGRLCAGVALVATSVQAQTSRRSPKEIGQIIEAALQAVIPPGERLTSHTVAERGIRFDFDRTLAAFGYANDPDARTSLGLGRTVTPGADSLLADCDQLGTKACSRLGRSVYVFLTPESLSSSEAVVWVHVAWATTLSKRTYMSGSRTEVILSRSGSGPWTLVATGRRVISWLPNVHPWRLNRHIALVASSQRTAAASARQPATSVERMPAQSASVISSPR